MLQAPVQTIAKEFGCGVAALLGRLLRLSCRLFLFLSARRRIAVVPLQACKGPPLAGSAGLHIVPRAFKYK